MQLTCNICESSGPALISEEASVRSNVRAFARERFRVWRCSQCDSIHARDEVDQDRYYAGYPFHGIPDDWRTRVVYDNQLRRLTRAGLRPHHSVLDYGCGGGNFVRHLRRRGYRRAVGFDAYSKAFCDRMVLERRYDAVLAQDVIEHVPSPRTLLEEFERLTLPGGMIAIGTPNASAIDLVDTERTIHALHLPYHRHILSTTALLALCHGRGWRFERYHRSEYGNTLVPCLNASFMLFYMRASDNSIDALFEMPKLPPFMVQLPRTLFWAFLGYFFAPETDVMTIFRTPTARSSAEVHRSDLHGESIYKEQCGGLRNCEWRDVDWAAHQAKAR